MDIFLLVAALATAVFSGWIYWQVQQCEQRMQKREDDLRQKTALIGELADELSMASQYLYESMDQCLARIDEMEKQLNSFAVKTPQSQPHSAVAEETLTSPSALHSAQHQAEAPAAPVPAHQQPAAPCSATSANQHAGEGSTGSSRSEDQPYHPHLLALELAAQEMEPVEIARHTGLGIEELRLLLRFQHELFGAVSGDPH